MIEKNASFLEEVFMISQLAYTPISYAEAEKLLQCKKGKIATIVHDNRLTPIPSLGSQGMVIKEQVELFIGKNQVRLSMLSDNEQEKWRLYRDLVQGKKELPEEVVSQDDPFPETPLTFEKLPQKETTLVLQAMMREQDITDKVLAESKERRLTLSRMLVKH